MPKGFQRKNADPNEDQGTEALDRVIEPLKVREEFQLPQVDLKIDGNEVTITRLVLTPELVAVALYEARGAVSVAARKCNTTARVIERYIRNYELCADAVTEARTMLDDFVEAKLMQKIAAGDTASIIFYLRTKGKKRGYTEKDIETNETSEEARKAVEREAKAIESSLLERLTDIRQRLSSAVDVDIELPSEDYEEIDGNADDTEDPTNTDR